ncbi:MAG: S-adenosylmethionine decarboxylase [Nanoarchaeota archaeon]|nr:S-adenosylmethionine decarboxylase [Nanoarchaeota archaeon]MBU1104177.1 S-adenosylmethionine decarboxylase [Nanoarchaeota archaeon]
MQNKWGQLTAIDLFECREDVLKDKKKLEEFCLELCGEIGMKPFGRPMVERFGDGELEGNSALQFIETSSISVHCDEVDKRVFVDIFSCKEFDAKKARKFVKKFFDGKRMKSRTMMRG